MRDELDGRMWVAHHDQFNQWVDGAIAGIGGALRLGSLPRLPAQLLSVAAAVGLTALTFGAAA